MNGVRVHHLTQQAATLPMADYLEFIERLIHRLREQPPTVRQRLDWTPLYGMGKGLWHGDDAQEYVNRLREDRL